MSKGILTKREKEVFSCTDTNTTIKIQCINIPILILLNKNIGYTINITKKKIPSL